MNESVEKVARVLTELVKAALVSDDSLSLDFRNAARDGRAALVADPPEPGSVKIDGAWIMAVRAAENPDLIPEEGRVSLTLPPESPFTIEDLLDPAFDVDAAVDRIAKSAATG